MKTTKTEQRKTFTAMDSKCRLCKVQKLCVEKECDGIFLTTGMDVNGHVGSLKAINFLLNGYSGQELYSSVLGQEPSVRLDDLMVMIRPESVSIYCNPDNLVFLKNITSLWPNVEYLYIEDALYYEDLDWAEEYKVRQFIRLVNELNGERVGIPVTPTLEKPDGSRFEVESFPLFQAYGLTDFGQGQFFSMKFHVVKIFDDLLKIYSEVDAPSLRAITGYRLSSFRNQWENMISVFERKCRIVDQIEELSEVSEVDIAESLITNYDFGIKDASGNMLPQRQLPYPKVLFGKRSQDLSLLSNENATVGTSQHFVCEASDPQGPICVCRTYFLTTGDYPRDPLLEKNDAPEGKKILSSFDNTKALNLMRTYFELISVWNSCLGFISKNDFVSKEEWKHALETKIKSSKLSFKKLDLKFDPIDFSAYVGCPNYVPKFFPASKYGLMYFRIAIDYENEGGIGFGNIIAISKQFNSGIKSIVSLTEDFPSITCYLGTAAERGRYTDITSVLESRIVKSKLPHPTMKFLLHKVSDQTITFDNSIFSHVSGDLYFFSEGLLFHSQRFGTFSIPFTEALSEMVLYQNESKEPHSIELKLKPEHTMFAPLKLMNSHSVIIYFAPISRMRRLYRQDIEPVWKDFCLKFKIPFTPTSSEMISQILKRNIETIEFENVKRKKETTTSINFFTFGQPQHSKVLVDVRKEFLNLLTEFQMTFRLI